MASAVDSGSHLGGGTWLRWWTPPMCHQWTQLAQAVCYTPASGEPSPLPSLQGPHQSHEHKASHQFPGTEYWQHSTNSMCFCWKSQLHSQRSISSPYPSCWNILLSKICENWIWDVRTPGDWIESNLNCNPVVGFHKIGGNDEKGEDWKGGMEFEA